MNGHEPNGVSIFGYASHTVHNEDYVSANLNVHDCHSLMQYSETIFTCIFLTNADLVVTISCSCENGPWIML